MKTTNKMMAEMWANWKDGDIIEVRDNTSGWRESIYEHPVNINSLGLDEYEYRIKPKHKKIPWDIEDFKQAFRDNVIFKADAMSDSDCIFRIDSINSGYRCIFRTRLDSGYLLEYSVEECNRLWTLEDGSKLEKNA